ncbi:MAG: TMEM143 family protein [Gammaproteobacteria bacterium]|nr:TMEM143 family protein [Gammaproteobacteria bacterium]
MTDPGPALRFIPFRKRDIIEMCLGRGELDAEAVAQFREFCRLLQSVFHFEFHAVLEALKDSYAAVDPDAATRRPDGSAPEAPAGGGTVELLTRLLDKANYERLTQADIDQALNESSLFKIRLHVDFGDFSEVLLYCRGVAQREEIVREWWGLRRRSLRFTNYDRVVLYLRFRPDYDPSRAALPVVTPGAVLVRMFQNVPKADLEMLFPNTSIRMRTVDKLMIGVPAAVSGGIILATKLGATLVLLGSLIGFWLGLHAKPVRLDTAALTVLFAGLATLGGYFWKQFSNYKNRKLRFMQSLTQNLYFKNLDNNAGVFHRLVDEAEEEECKEAILAYYFLLAQRQPMTRAELDSTIERWLRERWQCDIDFEVGDALDKLQGLGLLVPSGDRLSAVTLDVAMRQLDQRWDDYFRYE